MIKKRKYKNLQLHYFGPKAVPLLGVGDRCVYIDPSDIDISLSEPNYSLQAYLSALVTFSSFTPQELNSV